MDNTEYGREKLKDIVENKARQEKEETEEQAEEQTEDNVDLTAAKNRKTLKGAYRNFMIPGIPSRL